MSIALADGRKRPIVAVAISIDGGPVNQTTFHIVLFEIEGIAVSTRVVERGIKNHITRSGNIVLNALLGFRSQGSHQQQCCYK